MTLTVRLAEPPDFDAVLSPCVEAFSDEAVSAWVIPDVDERRARTRELFETSLMAVVDAGQLLVAWTTSGEAVAASIWQDGFQPTPAGEGRLAVVRSATAARHPREPHVYLAAMAAVPHRRGLGAGTAMLRHGIEHVGGLPIYLEASTARNRELYARHGFTDHGPPIHLPDGGPSLQPMWRT